MKTENLIEKLSRDLQPVKPLPSTWWRASWLFLVMIGGSLAVFTLFSIRHDIHEALSRDQFWLGAGGLLLAWMFLGYSLALSQLPTFESKKYFSVGIIFIDLLAFVYLIKAILAPGGYLLEGFSLSGVKCSLDILLLCLIPFILMIWILKKSAPRQPGFSGFNLGLYCAAFGMFLLQFSCPSENTAHLLMWHLICPMLFLAGFGVLVGKRILKW